MNFWDFWDAHWFLAWCALWLAWGAISLISMSFKLISRMLRSINIAIRGWPPEHLDADGDWKRE